MAVGIGRLAELRFPTRERGIRGASAAGAAHIEAVLDEGDAETGARAVLGGVGGVQEVGEEEANELEGHADHAVPDEGEEGADGQAFVVDFVSGHAGGEDGGFPVGRGCVGGGLFVGLGSMLAGRSHEEDDIEWAYRWLFFGLLSMFWLRAEVCKYTVVRGWASSPPIHPYRSQCRSRSW